MTAADGFGIAGVGVAFVIVLVAVGVCGDLIESLILDEGGWLRSIREGATATIEGWGKDTKWNTSLFHLTMSDVCLFLTEWNMQTLLSSY